ncbi:MarR family transcriptional regulator [Albimonas sp. CAU 1670]|uniref:MarR family winged helix-turn-helix transcriptional regulator n=1 Tax=Albimonas sp. CAU 1670 TaxID=3032599 RepID=UPI0023DB450B|nr:MarR family transcriptional regulator [Albimonas sp. CAU 1670]MDF2233300.1 MarR family transcriptional regulator [Albimonas sp. CAU 1670]
MSCTGADPAETPQEAPAEESVETGAPPSESMLCFALYSASHAMNRVYRPWLERLGLTYPQFLAMTALWSRDDRMVGELCAELKLATSTLTPVLKRLETLGLIERRRDHGDARAVRVTLTPEGRALHSRTEGLGPAILEATGMTLQEALSLNAAVAGLRDRLLAHADRRDAEAAA